MGKGHTGTLDPATGKTANGHPRTRKARAVLGWPAPAAFHPGRTTGTPVRARDLRSLPELRDHEQRQGASGREEGWAPRASVASGPPVGAELQHSRYLPRLPEPWPKAETSAPHV